MRRNGAELRSLTAAQLKLLIKNSISPQPLHKTLTLLDALEHHRDNNVYQQEVQIANGKTPPQACKEAGIHTQTYYRWRKEYGGLKVVQAKRLKELEKENGRLKRLVAELSLEKQVLRDVARGNF